MPELLTVNEPRDWTVLRDLQATVVLDPTAVRVAELFAGGHSAATDHTWDLISRQLNALATFVDALVLYPRIPLFDYQITYDRSADQVLGHLQMCRDVIVPVRVATGGVGDSCRLMAAEAMKAATPLPPEVADVMAADLETQQWQYRWKDQGAHHGDDLSCTPNAGSPTQHHNVNSFLYVSLLYANYAQELDGLNVIPPALSSLQLSTAFSSDDSGLDEAALFSELAEIWNATPDGVKRTLYLEQPSFLPYLLTFKDKTPRELLERALDLRDDPSVSPYREWLLEARAELSNGELSTKRRKQIQDAAVLLTRRLRERLPDVPMTVGLQGTIDTNFVPAPSAEMQVNMAGWRDWLLAVRPGRRYQKLLLRMVMAQRDKIAPERQLRKLWDRA